MSLLLWEKDPVPCRGVWVGLKVSIDSYVKCQLYKALNPGPSIQSIVSHHTKCALLATPGYVWGRYLSTCEMTRLSFPSKEDMNQKLYHSHCSCIFKANNMYYVYMLTIHCNCFNDAIIYFKVCTSNHKSPGTSQCPVSVSDLMSLHAQKW
jgi:hypothetical protein